MKEEPFFIAYANLPLFDAPGKLIDLIQTFLPAGENQELLFILQAVKKFHLAKCDYGAHVCLQRYPQEFERMAYDAVYGYTIYSCKDCLGFPLEQFSWFDPGQRQLYCFECQQVRFRYQLGSAIHDRFDSFWLGFFAQDSKHIVGIHLEPSWEESGNKHGKHGGGIDVPHFEASGLEERISIDWAFLRQGWGPPGDPYFDRLNFFIRGIVHFDLLNFLKHSKRDLIKHCPVCDRYFIGARAKGTYCSDKCRSVFHNDKKMTKETKLRYWHAEKNNLS